MKSWDETEAEQKKIQGEFWNLIHQDYSEITEENEPLIDREKHEVAKKLYDK